MKEPIYKTIAGRAIYVALGVALSPLLISFILSIHQQSRRGPVEAREIAKLLMAHSADDATIFDSPEKLNAFIQNLPKVERYKLSFDKFLIAVIHTETAASNSPFVFSPAFQMSAVPSGSDSVLLESLLPRQSASAGK